MKLWNANLFVHYPEESMKSNKNNVNCGIFQGGSLTPLLFCLSLMLLTNEHNITKYE